jgi:HlyD family secretion protein
MLQKADVAEVLAAEGRSGQVRRRVRIAVIVLVLVVAGATAFWLWSAWRGAITVAYATDPASRGDITVTLSATGVLGPVRSAPVSSLVNGTVTAIDVDYNDPVTLGQTLARLDPTDLQAAWKRAVAGAGAASANRDAASIGVDDALAALRRAEQLDETNNISTRDLELAAAALARARTGLASAEAQLQASQADLEAATTNLARASIVSPIDGLVLDMDVDIGQTVGPALLSPLFTIASNLDRLELAVSVDEADVTQVSVGDVATFTVEAARDRLIRGTIEEVHSGPKVQDGITSYVAVIAVRNSDLLLKPGMTATAEIVTEEARDVLTVADSALRFLPPGAPPPEGPSRVYVLRDGEPQMVAVVIGISNGQRTEITAGDLEAGDPVIIGIAGR